MSWWRAIAMLCLAGATTFAVAPPTSSRPFAILVVDEQTGRGVPLVELRTVHGVRLVTDSAGVAVVEEPGLEGQRVYFHIASHGYTYRKDGFGYRGRALRIRRGEIERWPIQRVNLAERLYRVTGAGIYRDSVLAGRSIPLREPLLNGQVFGCDSVLTAVYRGKLHWFYGDTNRPGYPLGNFQVSGAVSDLPGKGGLAADVGFDQRWFVDDRGFAKAMAPMPGKGPTWLVSLTTLPDAKGRERLVAGYVKVKPPLTVYGRGLAIFNDAKEVFEPLAEVPLTAPAWAEGHVLRHREEGVDYLMFCRPFPLVRVRATLDDLCRPERYESYTCLKQGSRLDTPVIDRDAAGKVRYGWKRDTPPVGPAEQERLIAASKLKRSEAIAALCDRDTGKSVRAHAGSVAWNPCRKRWVLITVEVGGSSHLGEVWYAEADAPVGPWGYAVKVVTHQRYSFYNPLHHPMLDQHGGRVIFFEGTYTHTFSGNPDRTPRYDYNQVLYRLDLSDRRLALPVRVEETDYSALDRPGPGTVPFRPEGKDGPVRFHVLPAEAPPSPTTILLYEHVPVKGGTMRYATQPILPGYQKGRPIARVWRNPKAE